MLNQDLQALWLSFRLALATSSLLLLLCIPLAALLSGKRNVVKELFKALLTLPLVLPPTVLGFYLLLAFGTDSMPARFLLRHFNIRLLFSFQGLLFASVIYSIPFMLSPLLAAFKGVKQSIRQASASLGKYPFQTFIHVVLPLSRRAMLSGFILCFAHTLGEFGIVLMIGGNIPAKTRLVSIALYDYVEQLQYGLAANLALILLTFSFVLILGLQFLSASENLFPE